MVYTLDRWGDKLRLGCMCTKSCSARQVLLLLNAILLNVKQVLWILLC